MKHVATYFHPRNMTLIEGTLCEYEIPYILQRGEEDLDTTELYVPPEYYETACELAERLEEFLAEKMQEDEKSKRECVNCKSTDLRPLSNLNYEKSITGLAMVFKCNKCGHANPDSWSGLDW